MSKKFENKQTKSLLLSLLESKWCSLNLVWGKSKLKINMDPNSFFAYS